jgi:hypothetical protein
MGTDALDLMLGLSWMAVETTIVGFYGFFLDPSDSETATGHS